MTDDMDCPKCDGRLRLNDWGFAYMYFKCTKCEYRTSSYILEQQRKKKQVANKKKYHKFLTWLRTGRVIQ